MHHVDADKAYEKKRSLMAIAQVLRAILNKSWKQHPTKQQLYVRLPFISKTLQVRRTRLRDCLRYKDELISEALLWTVSHGQAGV